jgi:hypothetical protein
MMVSMENRLRESGRRSLESALLLNGAFSGVCGFTFMMFAAQLVAWTGFDRYVGDWAMYGVGGMLALYALLLFVVAMRPAIPRLAVQCAVVMDAGWVLGTLPLLLMSETTPFGKALVAIVAIIVGCFGWAQWSALRTYRPQDDYEAAESTQGGDFRRVGRSWRGMKTWVKVWLFGLNAIFITAIAFIDRGHLMLWTLVVYIACSPYLFVFIAAQKGLSRVLGMAHIVPFTPLLAYLLIRLSADTALGTHVTWAHDPAYAVYLSVLAAALIFCLFFDYYDSIRWLRGERYLIGSQEAAARGASKATFG